MAKVDVLTKGGCINQTFSWRQKQNKHPTQHTQLTVAMLGESDQILYRDIHMNQENKC